MLPAIAEREQDLDVATASLPLEPLRWHPATRIAFRFCVIYFSLYVLSNQMISGPFPLPGDANVPGIGELPPLRNLTIWVAAHVFGAMQPLVISTSGSGDKIFDWVQVFCLLVISLVATSVWSVMDRRRDNYVALHKWFRLFLRFALGSTMILYGSIKAIPLQMSAPGLTRLLEPFGNFSPMGVLWASMGASRPYEIFTGCAELTAGILLFVPRLAMLGALVCLVDSIQIFTLNMTYDVPVKLFSFHLILMALLLLAPDASRLMNVLVLNRVAGPSTIPPLVRSRRGARLLLAAQLLLGAYIVGMNFYSGVQAWGRYGGGAPKSPLYGIWNVEQMTIDGTIRSPLVTDYDRWRRVVFQTPTGMSFQRMDDTFAFYGAKIDMDAKRIAVSKPADKAWSAAFTFDRPAPDRLVLDGEMDGHTIHMQLALFDRNRFLLVTRGFHWVQEYPFNR
jgi:hypothetical protein